LIGRSISRIRPGDEVVDDRLQAEADADRQRAGDDGEVGDVEAGVGDRQQGRERDADVARHHVDGIGDAGVEAALLQRLLPEPALEQPGGEQQRDEDDDAEQDAGKRDAELPDLDAEEQRLEPVADVGAREPPLQHQERQGGYDEREGERELGQPRQLVAARRVETETGLEHLAHGIAPLLRLARHRADGEIEQTADGDDDAGHHQLLGDEARQSDVAEHGKGEDAERNQPQGYFQPTRRMARHRTARSLPSPRA
jgi:hypothetical protein